MGRPTLPRARLINPRTYRTTWRVVPIGASRPLDRDQFDDYESARGVVAQADGSYAIVDAEGRFLEIRDRAGSYRRQQFALPA